MNDIIRLDDRRKQPVVKGPLGDEPEFDVNTILRGMIEANYNDMFAIGITAEGDIFYMRNADLSDEWAIELLLDAIEHIRSGE